MANTYHEVLTFVGRPESLAKLEPNLEFTTDDDGCERLSFYLNQEFQMTGNILSHESSPWHMSLELSMRRTPVALFFGDICELVPDLWMSSSSASALDNQYLLLAGFGSHVCFNGLASLHGGDWDPLPEEEMQRLQAVWDAFDQAEEAARKSFQRGAKKPLKAMRLIKAVHVAYHQNAS